PAETPPRLDGFDDLRVSCVSLAQLELGLRAAKDLATYRLRRARLDQITEQFGPGEPFDPACVQAFGRLLDHMAAAGGDLKANREDRMIAATALALDCVIVTRNPSDFRILEPLITVEVR
ncbi:MAG: hypothetical protein LBG60_03180, partial [Bifidobacteriaceae bacterium]|nr:hypothetical protein [Bifidobacteriaceae bacterium]